MTVGQRLEEVRGFGPGFDLLRVLLSISVVAIHVPIITGVASPLDQFWMFRFSILPMFFALSGFLIAGSAQRLVLSSFVMNRAFRILPALAVEIVLSALILGPLVTRLQLSAYFTDPSFFRYFRNIVGLIQYQLPGVFVDNHYAGIVNGSLWTVPHEMFCYIVMSGIMLFGLLKRPTTLVLMTSAVVGLGILLQLTAPHANNVLSSLAYSFVDRGAARLVPAFLAGLLIHQFRYVIPLSWPILIACLAICGIVQVLGPSDWERLVVVQAITTPLLAYVTVYFGLLDVPKLPIIKDGDYSYGIYLYSCPIQQTLIWLLPHFRDNGLNFVVSVALSALFAAFSWHFIEKPALRLRKSFSLQRSVEHSAESQNPALASPSTQLPETM